MWIALASTLLPHGWPLPGLPVDLPFDPLPLDAVPFDGLNAVPVPELALAAGSGVVRVSRCRLAGGGGGGGQGRDLPRPHVVSVVLDTNSSTLGRIELTTLLFPLGKNMKGHNFPHVVVMLFMTHVQGQTTCTTVKQQRLHACRVSYMLAQPRGWQRAASRLIDDNLAIRLMAALDPASQALLQSQAGPFFALVLTVSPTAPELRLSSAAFRILQSAWLLLLFCASPHASRALRTCVQSTALAGSTICAGP